MRRGQPGGTAAWCARSASAWVRASGSRARVAPPGSTGDPGFQAPAGGRGARLGRRCSARSGGLGELCPPVPKAPGGDPAAGSPRL